jgi:hypothetical protein
MNKVLLFFISLFCLPVYAEWSEPYRIDNDGHLTYIDYESFNKIDKDTYQYVMKKNFSEPDTGALSARGLMEINCKESEYTIIHFSSYSQIDLKGKILFEGSINQKLPIENWSTELLMKDSFCKINKQID